MSFDIDTPYRPSDTYRDDERGILQGLIDDLFAAADRVQKIDLEIEAESRDLDSDLLEVVHLMLPGSYVRSQLVDQMNSIITAHGWGSRFGTVS